MNFYTLVTCDSYYNEFLSRLWLLPNQKWTTLSYCDSLCCVIVFFFFLSFYMSIVFAYYLCDMLLMSFCKGLKIPTSTEFFSSICEKWKTNNLFFVLITLGYSSLFLICESFVSTCVKVICVSIISCFGGLILYFGYGWFLENFSPFFKNIFFLIEVIILVGINIFIVQS